MNTKDLHPRTVPRREREKQQRQQCILDAAERVFALHGFHGASIDRIAAEAEFAPGTIYLYFKDKDALYSALFLSKLAQMVVQVEEAAQFASGPLDKLRNAIRAQFDFNERNREFFEVVTHHRPAEQTGGGESWQNIHEIIERHQRVITEIIKAAQRKKLIRSGDSEDYAAALLGTIIHLSHHQTHVGSSSARADFVFDLFLKGAQQPR